MKKALSPMLMIAWLFLSCTSGQNGNHNGPETPAMNSSESNIEPDTLTNEQAASFDALNSIQLLGLHLYSTFSGIVHDCDQPDSIFTISRSELTYAMEELLAKYYTTVNVEWRKELVQTATLAQEEYLVEQCVGEAFRLVGDSIQRFETRGTWVLPRVLDRRDVIIEW